MKHERRMAKQQERRRKQRMAKQSQTGDVSGNPKNPSASSEVLIAGQSNNPEDRRKQYMREYMRKKRATLSRQKKACC